MAVELKEWMQQLSQPEYRHILLNPLPTHGAPLGALMLAVALLLRSRPAQIAGLALIALSCLSAWMVVRTGHGAYDRVYAMSYDDAQAWLDLHAQRAEQFKWLLYATALVALAAIFMPRKFGQVILPLSIAALLLAVASSAAVGWVAHAGGKVRHSEFRDGPPPAGMETHDHGASRGHNHHVD